jgi:hypothetical protein
MASEPVPPFSRRPRGLAALAAIGLAAASPALAQDVNPVTPAAQAQVIRQSAFTLWWPEYERLMRDFRRNTPADAGEIALPEPSPDVFYREIEILGRIRHDVLTNVTLYSVSTEGDLFQALFVLNPRDRAWPLINRVDPAGFRRDMDNVFVDAMNALLEREDVRIETAESALKVARFTVEIFYNFDYKYVPSSVDSLTYAELNLVRVLNTANEIPQGLRRFDADNGNALLYGKIPERVRGTVTSPRARTRGSNDYVASFYSWHPQIGELKRWEIRMADHRLLSLKNQTIEKWVSFTVENF